LLKEEFESSCVKVRRVTDPEELVNRRRNLFVAALLDLISESLL